jgi:hypothetical protein
MDEMQEMLEHYRITKLVNEYCHGCDRGDEVRMGGVYAADSWDDHGLYKGPGKEFSQQVIANRAVRKDVMSHHLGQTLVKVDGDEAGAETYFIATVQYDNEAGENEIHHIGGRYVDSLIREGGKWKIKTRLTVRDWSITHPVVKDFMVANNFIAGQTDGSDPSFAALGVEHSATRKRSAA